MTEKVAKEKQKGFGIKRKKNACQPLTFSEKELKEELLRDAQALRMPAGTAEVVAVKVAEQVGKWVARRPAVTTEDVRRRVVVEAEKYSADLAYVYQNRGKII